MPQVEFTVDMATGESELRIKGVKGSGCKVIHNAVSADLEKALGTQEVSVTETPEMREQSVTVNQSQRVRLG